MIALSILGNNLIVLFFLVKIVIVTTLYHFITSFPLERDSFTCVQSHFITSAFYHFIIFPMHLREEREQRGLLYQFSDEKLFDLYTKGGEKFYVGFDPSSDSLQLGNMCAIMAAVNLMKYGNTCYFLV